MVCSKCGQELKEGAKFCTKCGTSFKEIVNLKPVNLLLPIISIILTIIGVIGFLFFLRGGVFILFSLPIVAGIIVALIGQYKQKCLLGLIFGLVPCAFIIMAIFFWGW